MKKLFVVVAASTVVGLASPALLASKTASDTSDKTTKTAITETKHSHEAPFHKAKEKLAKMTPEQRRTFMKEAKTKWEKLSPEEKIKFKVQMREKMHMIKKQQAERKMVKIYSLYLLEQQ